MLSYRDREKVALSIAGTCQNTAEYDYDLTYEEVLDIMTEFDVQECVVCGWYQYPSDYCSMHEHDEITCYQCCEEGQEA